MTANQVENVAARRIQFIAECAGVNGRNDNRQTFFFDTT